jgi:hypothetical protein
MLILKSPLLLGGGFPEEVLAPTFTLDSSFDELTPSTFTIAISIFKNIQLLSLKSNYQLKEFFENPLQCCIIADNSTWL